MGGEVDDRGEDIARRWRRLEVLRGAAADQIYSRQCHPNAWLGRL